jgi:hypothetical protein
VTSEGRAEIADFGLAKFAGRSEITTGGTRMGTVSYMSPEQARGDPVDHRTDIWSLGAMLYEMSTGQRPFRGDHDSAVIYSILNEEPEPMTSVREGVPQELQWIVDKAMAKDPDERYQTAADMLADLREFRRGLEAGERPRVRAPASRKTRLRKLLLPLGGVLLLAVAVLVLRPLLLREPAAPGPKPIAVASFENQTGHDAYDPPPVATWERMRDLLTEAGSDPVELAFEYADFASAEGLSVLEDAVHVDGVLRLTPSAVDRAGAAWYLEQQSIERGFWTVFQFQIGERGGFRGGGDGFAFVIQNASGIQPPGGWGGGGIGYQRDPQQHSCRV